MNVEEYQLLVHEDIELASKASSNSQKEEFLLYAIGLLANGEEFDDFIECSYEGTTRRNGNMRIDGYSINEADGSCSLFISEYFGKNNENSVKTEEINNSFKKLRLFVEEASRRELYEEITDIPQAAEFARDLFYQSSSITKFRFYLLTDAFNRQRTKTIQDDKIGDKKVELNVWDITRLYDLVCSSSQKESIEINIPDFGIKGIPCVKAVDYHDVVADIDIVPEFDGEEKSSQKPQNIVTYSSYLAVVPGKILSDLYLEYGAKLLEGNVRSFLSVRGKVNKSIQTTIKNYPEMFFAYNNGLSATASELQTDITSEGMVISKIKDLQIVNGGQTIATIAHSVLKAKKNDKIDLSNLYVPMKVSVLEQSMSEKIIPKIAEYSNSQNKVDASDFFSNHPFHIRIQDYSRKIAIPSTGGNQFQQYWFYERTRGQYNQGKMKFGARSSQLKQYSERFPEENKITMLELAIYMELYDCAPHIVSGGKQKTLKVFSEKIKTEWQNSDVIFNTLYYKRMVSIAILYRKTDEIVKNTEWYKVKRSYKANIIAYSLGIIFNFIKEKHADCELDFNRIWNTQDIYEELEDQLIILTKEVYDFITGPRDTENVTEWCKKESCWTRAKARDWTFNDPFIKTLISKQETIQEEKNEIATRKVANEVDSLKEVMARGKAYWENVLRWGATKQLLSEKESSILKIIINMNYTGRIPTDKQLKVVLHARERLIQNGMPLQFQ